MWPVLILCLLSVAAAQEYTGWGVLRNQCLMTPEIEFQTGIETEQDCLMLCQYNEGYPCWAVSYTPDIQRCGLYNTTSQFSFVQEPCATIPFTDTLEVEPYVVWNSAPQGCLAVIPDGEVESPLGVAICQELCEATTNFQCNSFTYHDGRCQFSKDSVRTMALLIPCNETTTDYHYYERSRSPLFKWFEGSTIAGTVSRTWADKSIVDCGILCEIETGFFCKSYTYRHATRQCELRSHNSVTNTLSTSSTHHYAERVERTRWRWEYDGCVDQGEVKETIGNLTVDGCYSECELHYGFAAEFNCTSVTYDIPNSQCYLSAENSYGSPSRLHIPCYNPLNYYAEIMCTEGASHPS